jgi:hypothetical protein
MTIPIEKGVPLPVRRPAVEEIVPELAVMDAGDSIFIPDDPTGKTPPILATSVVLYGMRVRKVFETEYQEGSKFQDGGLRVWRIE